MGTSKAALNSNIQLNINHKRPSCTRKDSGRRQWSFVVILQMRVEHWQPVRWPASHPHTQPARTGQEQRKQSLWRKPGRLKAIICPSEAEAVGGNTADWSASKQEGSQPPPPPLSLHVQGEVRSLQGEMGVTWQAD